jgi:hypothetical protein
MINRDNAETALFMLLIMIGGLCVSYMLDGWIIRFQVTIYKEVRTDGN